MLQGWSLSVFELFRLEIVISFRGQSHLLMNTGPKILLIDLGIVTIPLLWVDVLSSN